MFALRRTLGLAVPLLGALASIATSLYEGPYPLTITNLRAGDVITLDAANPRFDIAIDVVGNSGMYAQDDVTTLSAVARARIICTADIPCVEAYVDAGPTAASRVRLIQQRIVDDAPSGTGSVDAVLPEASVPPPSSAGWLPLQAEEGAREIRLFVRFELVDDTLPVRIEWNAHAAAMFSTRDETEELPPGAALLIGFTDPPPGFEPLLVDGDGGVIGFDAGGDES